MSDGEGTNGSDKEGTDTSGEKGTDGSGGEDLFKGGLVGHRSIHVTVLTLVVIFIYEDNFLRGQLLVILALYTIIMQ